MVMGRSKGAGGGISLGKLLWSWRRCTGAWGGVTVVRECDSHQGGVKGTRKVCQFYGEV